MQAFPSAMFMGLILIVPESPRWLITKKLALDQATKILMLIDPSTAQREADAIMRSQQAADKGEKDSLFNKKHRVPVMLAILFAIFNQVSGINAIIYYAPRIFEMTGLGTSSALLSTVGIGVTNLFFTLLAVNFIDRFGRKKLMLIGSFGLILTLALVSFSFYTRSFALVPGYLFAYIAFFAFSQGAVIWVFISEIFPNTVRAQGQSLGAFTHWLVATLIAFVFPYIASTFGGGTSFLIFGIMMVLQLIFVIKLMPETKGKSLEQIDVETTVHV